MTPTRSKAKADGELTHETLIRIADRIALPRHWTTGAVARDASGQPAPYRSRRAVCWCLNGAMLLETDGEAMRVVGLVYRRLQNAAEALYPDEMGFVAVNDHRGHDAALAVAGRARDVAAEIVRGEIAS